MGTTFAHVGITVTDIEKTCEFYEKYFGFKRDYGSFFDEGYFHERQAQFRQPPGVSCEMQMLRSPDGVLLELFRFSNAEPGGDVCWQRTGYNHITLLVDDIEALSERLAGDGVCVFLPVQKRSRGDGLWVYIKDPDGNVIELWG